jgi:hypothetical protein
MLMQQLLSVGCRHNRGVARGEVTTIGNTITDGRVRKGAEDQTRHDPCHGALLCALRGTVPICVS